MHLYWLLYYFNVFARNGNAFDDIKIIVKPCFKLLNLSTKPYFWKLPPSKWSLTFKMAFFDCYNKYLVCCHLIKCKIRCVILQIQLICTRGEPVCFFVSNACTWYDNLIIILWQRKQCTVSQPPFCTFLLFVWYGFYK